MAGITIQDSESLELYLKDISSSKPLSAEEEVRLARKIKAGDQMARAKLVAANLTMSSVASSTMSSTVTCPISPPSSTTGITTRL